MIDPEKTKFVWLGSMGDDRLYVINNSLGGQNPTFITLAQLHSRYDANCRYVFLRPAGLRSVLVADMHSLDFPASFTHDRNIGVSYLMFRTFTSLDRAIAEMSMRYDNGI